jgi:hypothetical protein
MKSLYLDLLKKCLARTLFPDANYNMDMQIVPYDPEARRLGHLWPTEALTLVGVERLNLVEKACLDVVANNIPGDFVECGVWRGGCSILMRAVLAETGDETRRVWLFDSFEGLPKPEAPQDAGDRMHEYSYFAVPLETVQDNFRAFDLLDGRVYFRKGWFKDTLPQPGIPYGDDLEQISVLRLDGDMYDSTMLALENLYPRLSPGGYCLVDDYGALRGCRQAVKDYRQKRAIHIPLRWIDWTGVYWQLPRA